MRVLVWFSCGAASWMAAMEALAEYGERVQILYCNTFKYEHPDNRRFFKESQKSFGKKIKVLKSREFRDVRHVWEITGWLVGPGGARCTTEMKKVLRHEYERPGDIQIFGFTAEETKRVEDFKANNPDVKPDFILHRKGITRADCFKALKKAGIELPMMYRMGYKNNNCIGCVKGQAGYWNKIRKDFPETFDYMAKLERRLGKKDENGIPRGVAINKRYKGKTRIRVFLDELDPKAGRYEAEPDIECGVLCQGLSK